MNHGPKKFSMKNRRGVSNIIGSLIVLAVVASVGSVILFQGLNQINAFNYDLTLHDREHVNELREDIIFEHVRFDPTSTDLILNLANIGSIDSNIATITVVKIDTQELLVARLEVSSVDPTNAYIPIEDHREITIPASLPLATPEQWDSPEYGDTIPIPTYKITISTAKGNFFSTIASPFNS